MKAAYAALPEEKKKNLGGLVAEHSLLHSRNKIAPGLMDRKFQQEVPPVKQKLVREIPETGEKTFFVGAHASHVIGWPIGKGRALLEELMEWATQLRFVYKARLETEGPGNVGQPLLPASRPALGRGKLPAHHETDNPAG